jgi:hypothetical protein
LLGSKEKNLTKHANKMSKAKLKHANAMSKDGLITDVKLKNGANTKVIMIFDKSEISFEDMISGMENAIKSKSKSYNSTKANTTETAKAREDKKIKDGIVTYVELKNGANTKVFTIFDNSEIRFEDMISGIENAIKSKSKSYNSMKCKLEKSEIFSKIGPVEIEFFVSNESTKI